MTTRNGDMPWCLWRDCPTTCCAPKKKIIFDEKNGYFFQDTDGEVKYEWPHTSYITSLTQEEKNKLDGKWLVIETHPVLVNFTYNPTNGEIDYFTRQIHALSNCLSKSWCKLGEDRPSMCKLFPFTPHEKSPLNMEICKQVWEIVKHQETIVNVIKTIAQIFELAPVNVEKYIDELLNTLNNNNMQVSRTKEWILKSLNV